MRRSNRILHFDYLDLLGMALALSLISLRVVYVIPVACFFIYRIRHHVCMLLFWSLFGLFSLLYFIHINESTLNDFQGEVIVVDETSKEYSSLYTVRYQGHKYYLFGPKDDYHVGDRIILRGSIDIYPKRTIPKGFDPNSYYTSIGIDGTLVDVEIIHIESGFSFWALRETIKMSIETSTDSPYVMAMLFGETYHEEEKLIYQELGLGFLLSVSGIHLYVVAAMFKKIFFYLDIPMKYQTIFIMLFYGWMCYMHACDSGIMRLFLMSVAVWINDKYDFRRSKNELFHLVMGLLLVLNIKLMLTSTLFILYLILLSFYLLEPLYRGYHPLMKRGIMSVIVLCVMLPFQGVIYLLGIILIPLIGPLLATWWMVSSFGIAIFPSMNIGLFRITHDLHSLLSWLGHHSISIVVGRLTSFSIVIYFLLIVFFLLTKQKMVKGFMILTIVLLYLVPSWIHQSTTSITFLDVGQGDSTIITSKGCITVIDAFDYVGDYLINHGISTIDYLILTHSDLDHIKEVPSLINRLTIKQLILSSKDHEYPAYTIRPTFAKAGDHLSCGDISLHILAPFDQVESNNDASIIIQTTIRETTFLLMGDAEFDVEMRLIEIYGNQLKSDVLKVGHHGSKTSTSSLFLHYVKPEKAIISVSRSNRYGFPHVEVIERLRNMNITIDRTDLQGTIRFVPTKKKHNWQYALPF
ncbi:MAG TPA: ComEC/Rec2 family competence protein [Acholeplasmataceae bacterium]|nr:ComEC/Rec2 family competence protein [Acholeplasmataceae bacterium]